MPLNFVRQLFTDGFTNDSDPAAIDLGMQDNVITKISDVKNFLFERGLMVSRPPTVVPPIGAARAMTTGTQIVGIASCSPSIVQNSNGIAPTVILGFTGAGYVFYAGFLIVSFNPTAFRIDAVPILTGFGNIYSMGPQVWAGDASVVTVNQAVCIGGPFNGIVVWQPPGTGAILVNTTASGNSGWLYLTKLYSRCIGAFATNGTSAQYLNPITIGASAAGDVTDWTSVNAYSTVLSDVADEITGLGVIKGVVVVPRRYGFHVGYATGQSPAIFNWSAFNDVAVGCMPGTFKVYNNVGFFVSDQGVHTFDLVNVVDIGESIYTDLIPAIQDPTGVGIQTFISMEYRQDFQPCYNILLQKSSGGILQHLMYNIREGKWSKHEYYYPPSPGTFPKIYGFPVRANYGILPYGGLGFLTGATDSPGYAQQFNTVMQTGFSNEGSIPEALTFVTAAITLQPSYQDSELSRVMLVVYAGGTMDPPTMVWTSLLNQTQLAITFEPAATVLNAGWNYIWYNGRATGQNFQGTVTFSGTVVGPIKVKEMWYEFSTSGKQRA